MWAEEVINGKHVTKNELQTCEQETCYYTYYSYYSLMDNAATLRLTPYRLFSMEK